MALALETWKSRTRSWPVMSPAALGALGWLALASPWARTGLETSLIGHMLVQIPLLVACGWLLGHGRGWGGAWNGRGIPGVLLAVFALAFWMIPRWLDAALSDPAWEAAKFVSLPLLVGWPMGLSWPRLPALARGFVWANGLSMLAVVGWLYWAAPVRVCNNYLADQQADFGLSAFAVVAALAGYWTLRGFFGDWRARASKP